MFGTNIKLSGKILAIAAFSIGLSAIGFAQRYSNGSVVKALNNADASSNIAPSTMNSHTGGNHGSNCDGDHGGDYGRHHGGAGSRAGGHDHGWNCFDPPAPVPEPFSMLALGIGSGIVMLKKRAKKA
jgi:hypothetical protein